MAGRLPGLLTPPSGAAWIAERLAWLPVFAAALAVAWLLFHRFERRGLPRPLRPRPRPAGPAASQPSAVFSRSSSPSCSSHSDSGRWLPNVVKYSRVWSASSCQVPVSTDSSRARSASVTVRPSVSRDSGVGR